MDDKEEVVEETLDTPEEVVETPETPTEDAPAETPEVNDGAEELKKQLEIANNYKVRAEKAESERKALEAKLNKANETGEKPTLGVEDYIDISASLEGLDQREKEKLAQEHRLTNKPLAEIRKDEDFLLWQTAYREKVEKDKTLAPNSPNDETDKSKSLTEQLATATIAEKEKLLEDAGLWKSPRPRKDKTTIGDGGGIL